MALGKKGKQGGLDLSGVGGGKLKLGGGDPRGHNGLAFGRKNSVGSRVSKTGGKGSIPRQVQGSGLGGVSQRGLSSSRVVFIVIGVLVALGLAIGVGVLVYQHTLRSHIKPELSDGVTAILTQDEDATRSWVALAITDATSAAEIRGSVKSLALISLDSENKTISILWIPTQTRVYIAGYGYRTIGESFDINYEQSLISSVEELAGVTVSHYMEINQAGCQHLMESSECTQTGDDKTDIDAFIQKLMGSSNEQLKLEVGYINQYAATDMSEQDLTALASSVYGMDVKTGLHQAEMPTEADEENDKYLLVDTKAWATMAERVENGMTPEAGSKEITDNNTIRENYTVTIWNGVGVSGIASDCNDYLESKGWTIESTGNAAQFVYDETLVVYKYDDDEPVAQLLASDLGQGRVVRSAARYNFTGDVLVVVGGDYQPY